MGKFDILALTLSSLSSLGQCFLNCLASHAAATMTVGTDLIARKLRKKHRPWIRNVQVATEVHVLHMRNLI